MKGIYKKAWESYLRPFHVQGLRNAHHRERTTQKAHADMYNTRNLPLFSQKEARMYINTHQEDVLVAIRHSGGQVCEVLKHERQTLVNVFSIYTAPPPPGGFLRKSPLQMYKKISLVRQL